MGERLKGWSQEFSKTAEPLGLGDRSQKREVPQSGPGSEAKCEINVYFLTCFLYKVYDVTSIK